jgi:nitroreductase
MTAIASQALEQIFTEARSFSFYLPEPVSDDTLHAIYNVAKMGATSANTCPLRIVFVRTEAAKGKLLACVSPTNVDKVKSAPVTAIFANDAAFFDQIPNLFPQAVAYRDMFENNAALSEVTAMRNGSLQAAYFMLAARSLGIDCGPMSGFDNAKVDAAFFAGTTWKSNFICNLGYGDRSKLFPRLPRLSFEQACRIE